MKEKQKINKDKAIGLFLICGGLLVELVFSIQIGPIHIGAFICGMGLSYLITPWLYSR